jgi:hypothetical protein
MRQLLLLAELHEAAAVVSRDACMRQLLLLAKLHEAAAVVSRAA